MIKNQTSNLVYLTIFAQPYEIFFYQTNNITFFSVVLWR